MTIFIISVFLYLIYSIIISQGVCHSALNLKNVAYTYRSFQIQSFVRHSSLYFESEGVYTVYMILPLSRIAIFVIYFWFGFLKIIDASPASPLVESLLNKTLPFIGFDQFIVFLGIWEMIIGITFLLPKLERIAIALLIPHMITTFMPLILLPTIAWKGFLTPTLEGQYMIKNILIIALAVNIISSVESKKK